MIDLIASVLDLNPLTRYKSEDALNHQFIQSSTNNQQLMSLLNKRTNNSNNKMVLISSDEQRQIIIEAQIKLLQNKESMSSIDLNNKFIKVRGYIM